MDDGRITLERDELFTRTVDEELARMRARQGGRPPDPPPLSPMRRLLTSNLFYLPAAAGLGALLAWVLLEPHINDMSLVGGDVVLVNDDPFLLEGVRSITVEGAEFILGEYTELEPGADGQPPYTSVDDVAPGDSVEVVGILGDGQRIIAMGLRPSTPSRAAEVGVHLEEQMDWAMFLLFPVAAVLIAFALLFVEGLSSRNWNRMIVRAFIGTLLALVFSVLAMFPAGLIITVGDNILEGGTEGMAFWTVHDVSGTSFVLFAACRSLAWAFIGAGVGLGMNLSRSTRAQLRNAVLGGALGGALGGLFFDPIDRFVSSASYFNASAGNSRLVGLVMVGLCIGLFVALVERLARVAWIRVRTGPLAGKAFVLYRTPTTVGSSVDSDIYLFKDAEIDPDHARIHRVGNNFEIEDAGSRAGTAVNDRPVRRRRLVSGDQIAIGSTVLEFEERAKTSNNP